MTSLPTFVRDCTDVALKKRAIQLYERPETTREEKDLVVREIINLTKEAEERELREQKQLIRDRCEKWYESTIQSFFSNLESPPSSSSPSS